MRFYRLSFFLLISIISFFTPQKALASSLVINEFLANPSSGNNEWIEFYNPSNIDLSTYWVDDDTSFTEDSGNSSKKSLSIVNINNLTYPYIEVSSFLNNSGDYVALFSNEGTLIDQYQYNSDPGKDLSIGRSTDGGSWTNLISPSKGFSNNSQTSSPTPSSSSSPSPSPSPTPTPTPSPSPNTIIFEISNIPSNIKLFEYFAVKINLKNLSASSKYFLKGAFIKDGSSNYFGRTKVEGSWVKNNQTYSSQLSILTDSSGNWSGEIVATPDNEDLGFSGTGLYIFKVARYNSSGSGPTWSNSLNIEIIKEEIQPSPSLSNDIPPSPSPENVTYQEKTDDNKNTYNIPKSLININLASVAGEQTDTTSPILVKNESKYRVNPYLATGLVVLVLGAGSLVYFLKKS